MKSLRSSFVLFLLLLPTAGMAVPDECVHFSALSSNHSKWRKAGIVQVDPRDSHPRPVSTSERNFSLDVREKILPFAAARRTGQFTGKDGVPISYHVFETPKADRKGAIVVSHGRGDTLSHYLEAAHNFADWGFDTYFVEHRGHGGSGRLLPNPHKVHVEHFEDYVEDFETFMADVVSKGRPERTILFGVSMGGQVAAQYNVRNPEGVDQVVLTVPMIRPLLKGIPEPVARTIIKGAEMVGKGDAYALGEKDFQYPLHTGPHPRGEWLKNLVRARQFHGGTMGGSTFHWVGQSLRASAEGRRAAKGLKTPTLVIAAGRDTTVDNEATLGFCRDHQNCVLFISEEGKHTLFNGPDAVRNPVFGAIRNFILPTSSPSVSDGNKK